MVYYTFRVIVVAITTLFFLTACVSTPTVSNTTTPGQTTTPTATNYLPLLQGNGHLAARLYGLVTFSSGGTRVTFPAEFWIPPVPITWTGASFSGRLEEAGAGEDITDEVTGVASPDGAILVSSVYSRRVIRANNNGTLYRVTLQNVPLASVAGGTPSPLGTFDRGGADLEKYVARIEYADGPVNSGQIVPTTTYVSTDWANTASGQTPTLKIAFGR